MRSKTWRDWQGFSDGEKISDIRGTKAIANFSVKQWIWIRLPRCKLVSYQSENGIKKKTHKEITNTVLHSDVPLMVKIICYNLRVLPVSLTVGRYGSESLRLGWAKEGCKTGYYQRATSKQRYVSWTNSADLSFHWQKGSLNSPFFEVKSIFICKQRRAWSPAIQ